MHSLRREILVIRMRAAFRCDLVQPFPPLWRELVPCPNSIQRHPSEPAPRQRSHRHKHHHPHTVTYNYAPEPTLPARSSMMQGERMRRLFVSLISREKGFRVRLRGDGVKLVVFSLGEIVRLHSGGL